LMAVLGVPVGLGIFYNQRMRLLVAAANRRFPGHVTAYGQTKATEFLDGMAPMRNIARLLGPFSLSATIWILEAGSCYCVGSAVWRGMDISTAILFLV